MRASGAVDARRLKAVAEMPEGLIGTRSPNEGDAKVELQRLLALHAPGPMCKIR